MRKACQKARLLGQGILIGIRAMERKLTMYKKISTVLIVILCICIMAAATIVAYAEGESEEGSTSETTASQETTSSGTNSESENTDGDESKSQDSSDTGENSSEEIDPSSQTSETSSSTSSKKSGSSGKVKSGGAKGTTKTFIMENIDGDGNSSIVAPATDSDEDNEGMYADYESTGEEELTDHFVGRVVSYGDRFYKWIYLPVIVSVLCIVALLYINLIYKKRIA